MTLKANAEIIGRASPIHLIGESHVVQFSDLMLRTRQPAETFLCQVKFFRDLLAHQYFEDGVLAPSLIEHLKASGILDADGNPAWLAPAASAAYLSGRAAISPAMVFFAGDMNLQTIFAQMDGFDFELPDDPGYGVDLGKEPVAFAGLQAAIETVFQPFLSAMQTLRRSFPRLMVHGLPPRTRNEVLAARWSFNVVCPAPIRSKLAITANRLLASACQTMDVAFIDTWDQTSQDSYARPDLELDGLHLGRAAALASLEAITGALFDRTGPTANPTRYAIAAHHAPAYAGPAPADLSTWTDAGYVIEPVADPALLDVADSLNFVSNPANIWACTEWVGYPRAGRTDVRLAEPQPTMLQWATELLSAGPARAALQAGEPKDLTIVSFRPVELAAGGSTSVTALPTPPGCRRALLFLSGSGEAILQTPVGGAIAEATGQAGLLLVFDPARVHCRIAAAGEAARFIEIGLMPRYPAHPFRVLAAGLNDWPVDPFHYPVAGLLAFPPFPGEVVHEMA